jgi:hypothetical protein
MGVDMSASEKIVSGLAIVVLLLGLATGAFAKRMGVGPSAAPVVSNASARHGNDESPPRRSLAVTYIA